MAINPTLQLTIAPIAVALLLVFACNTVAPSDPANENAPVLPGHAEPPASLPAVACLLQTYSYPVLRGKRELTVAYHQGKPVGATIETDGIPQIQDLRWHYSGERLDSVTNRPGSSGMIYQYNAAGNLIRIEGTGWYFTREFELDEAGRVIAQATFRQDSLLHRFEYSYADNGLPLTATAFDGTGDPMEKHQLHFDDGRNPFAALSAFVNPAELLYGYPVGIAAHNLSSITTTYLTPSRWKIEDEIKLPGDELDRSVMYRYNDYGYPISILSGKADHSMMQTLTYVCGDQ